MFSFCTGSHGLVEDEFASDNERRRPRHSSMPAAGTARSSTGVKRGASVGRKSGGRGGQQSNLKALIGKPTNFVHVSHGDGSSSLATSRDMIDIDIRLMRPAPSAGGQGLAGRDRAPRPVAAPIAPITESSFTDNRSPPSPPISPSASNNNTDRHSRRGSVVKRKAVPGSYGDERQSTIRDVASNPNMYQAPNYSSASFTQHHRSSRVAAAA